MTFLERCIEQSMPVWQSCLETAFLRRFADGTLDEACFKGYIVDDSLYLREYAKVFAYGILHAGSMEEIRVYYSLLSFVNESEDAARRHYLRRYGLTDEQIQVLPLRPENRAYVDDMLAAARDGGGSAACATACLPCMLSYGWIFREILRRSPQVLEGPFGPFVRDYTGTGTMAFARNGPPSATGPARGWTRRGSGGAVRSSMPAPSTSAASGR